MTLTPDDLPDNSAAQQVHCGCTSNTFHFVITPSTIRAVCSRCSRPNATWPRPAVTEGLPDVPPTIDPYRDSLPHADTIAVQNQPGGPVAMAAWSQDNPGSGSPAGIPQSLPGQFEVPDDASSITGADLKTADGAHAQPVHGFEVKGAPSDPPPLPHFSDGVANAYLEDGPYAGQITWTMGDERFEIVGVASYKATDRTKDGRTVWVLA